MIEAFSLDLWNTLIRSNPEGRYNRIKWLATKTNREEEEVKLVSEEIKRLGNESMISTGVQFSANTALERILQKLGHTPSAKELAEIRDFYDQSILLYPPLIDRADQEALVALSQEYPLYLVSNTMLTEGRVMRELLSSLGIISVFEGIIFSDEAGFAKPSRQIFESLPALGSHQSKCVCHVGDDLRTDREGAKRMGYQFLFAAVENRMNLATAIQPFLGNF